MIPRKPLGGTPTGPLRTENPARYGEKTGWGLFQAEDKKSMWENDTKQLEEPKKIKEKNDRKV